MSEGRSARLRRRVFERSGLIVPGAANALAARVIEGLGFEAVYLSGAAISNTFFALPDLGFIGLAEVAQHTAAVRNAVRLPIIVDADTGFGNALNVRHAVRTLEAAGASAIQIEDQITPKKCGNFAGRAVIPPAEMIGKIKAAVDARRRDDLMIIARTDARAVVGLDEAISRAAAYADAGADLTFVEAPESLDEISRIAEELPCPQVINVVIGGRTPTLDGAEYARMGFGMVLYSNAALQGAVRGMIRALERLRDVGRLDEDPQFVATFAQRQALVRKTLFDDLGDRYT